MTRLSSVLLATLLMPAVLMLAGCTPAVSLPRAGVPAPGLPGPEAEPTITLAESSVVVLYYVQCRSCEVSFSTPRGIQTQELTGGREFRVAFSTLRPGQSVVLQVTPEEGTSVNRARISAGSGVLAEVGRQIAGDPVNLSAAIS